MNLTDAELEALVTCRDFHSMQPPGENEEDDKIVAAVDSILARDSRLGERRAADILAAEPVLDRLANALNYLAFLDENYPGLLTKEFGGRREGELIVTLAMIQEDVDAAYDALEEEAGADE